MDRTAAVASIHRDLGFRSDQEANIITALQDTQVELERDNELPWFLKTEMSSINTTNGESRVPLPSDFLREIDRDEEGGLFYYSSTASVEERWKPLEKESLNTLIIAYGDDTGPPEAYAADDEYLRIFPKPDAAYPLKMIYYHKDTVLSSNVENKWLKYAHELMIGIAGQKIARPLRDAAALAEFQRMELRGRKRLMDENIARLEVGRIRQMGGKD